MIYTCTLNPSIDYVASVKNFKEGQLNRTETAQMYPGGKGINVSRVLKYLGTDSTALGFIGGFTGDFIRDYLTNAHISNDFIQVHEPTRINVKLKSDTETEINGLGPDISLEQQQELIEKVRSLAADDILVLAGSIPPSLSINFYAELSAICMLQNVRVVLDTTGETLKKTLPYKPFLIKPNHHELGDLFETTITTVEDAVHYGKRLLDEGAQNVIVSMAVQGAVFLNHDHVLLANVPSGTVKNSVGAGDSVVAGFLSQITQSDDIILAFKTGVASGSATAFSEDLCTKEHMESLLKEIKVQKLRG
ncbi:1-phosphofructokinase [Fictibacillus barbaricus]|uniref:Tagatose-6-phosphate kinase n=1 Tax=Fictibacillus barbaricus TaxID=182136 RepID=A0ABU1U518_9BACL|nr:1-phosphofructokinase [Fictibacillus barbaricus]MDR7074575.1 1-phosphofructokinase [Fictibacillus barbaricus]